MNWKNPTRSEALHCPPLVRHRTLFVNLIVGSFFVWMNLLQAQEPKSSDFPDNNGPLPSIISSPAPIPATYPNLSPRPFPSALASPAAIIMPSPSAIPATSPPSLSEAYSSPSDTSSPSSSGALSTPRDHLSPSGTSPLIPPPSSPTDSTLSPLLVPTPFPTVPLNTPPPGAFSVPESSGPQQNFPSALLPPIPNPPPPLTITRIRVAKTAELGINSPPLTLDDAVRYALKHNPDVLNAVEQIRVTRGQLLSIQSQLLPQLAITGSMGLQSPQLANPPRPPFDIDVPTTAPDGTLLRNTTKVSTDSVINNWLWNIQFGVQQLAFDGGGALAATRAAYYQEDRSYFLLRSVIDNVIAQIKIAFFQIILNRALIIVQEQSVALLENQLENQETRYEAGTVPKFNVLQAQVAVANAIPPLITARNNLRISQYQLVKLLGMNYVGDPTQVPFNVVGDLKVNFRKIMPEESIRIGLTRNPSLKAQRENILSQAASVTAALSGFYPRIMVGGGYMMINNYNYLNLTRAVEGWFFGFNGTWNIFDGLNTYGKVVQAKAQLEQAKINYDNTVRTVILNIQQDISSLQQAQETIESQQASVVQATEALRLSRERLDAGAGTQLDVLNAQVALLQAQTTVLQAQFNYIQFLAQYDAALSLNTRYTESFRDPLDDPEKWRFAKLNGAGYRMQPLPRGYRDTDPVVPIIGPVPTPSPIPPLSSLFPPHRTTHKPRQNVYSQK